jgi:hypothetical protein
MHMSVTELADKALSLPLESRADLALLLWESLEIGLPTSSSEEEIVSQALRRDQELASGTAASRLHEDVISSARSALRK